MNQKKYTTVFSSNFLSFSLLLVYLPQSAPYNDTRIGEPSFGNLEKYPRLSGVYAYMQVVFRGITAGVGG